MTNWRPDSPELYADVQTRHEYQTAALKKSPAERLHRLWRSSRDSARTPVQWSDAPNAGFTSAAAPWLPVNPNYPSINVEAEEKDPQSLLHFYRRAIRLRKALPAVRYGRYREFYRLSDRLYVSMLVKAPSSAF